MLPATALAKSVCKNILPSKSLSRATIRPYSLVKMTTQSRWKIEKNKRIILPIEEKRKLYKTDNCITLDRVETWLQYAVKNDVKLKKHTLDDLTEFKKIKINSEMDELLAEKVSIYRGDITKLEREESDSSIPRLWHLRHELARGANHLRYGTVLYPEVDAVVNAANSLLRAGGGVDGAIHRAAGPLLQEECNSLNGCPTGDAKVTGGYDLPAKYVIHTVGPQNGSAPDLQKCYEKCLSYQQREESDSSIPSARGANHLRYGTVLYPEEYSLNSIAFPCISTGIYGFPNRLAGHIALRTARKFLEANDHVQRVIFCTFMPVDVEVYETLMQMYFPLHQWNYNDGPAVSD